MLGGSDNGMVPDRIHISKEYVTGSIRSQQKSDTMLNIMLDIILHVILDTWCWLSPAPYVKYD